jgi:hypothetical protein
MPFQQGLIAGHGMEIGILGIIHLVLVVWAVWDLLTSHRPCCSILLWLSLIVIFPVVGPILYLIFGRSAKAA